MANEKTDYENYPRRRATNGRGYSGIRRDTHAKRGVMTGRVGESTSFVWFRISSQQFATSRARRGSATSVAPSVAIRVETRIVCRVRVIVRRAVSVSLRRGGTRSGASPRA